MARDRLVRALVVLLVLIAGLHLGGLLWDLGQRFGDIIVMFFLAWLLAFVLTPVTQAIERRIHVGRLLAASAVYFVLFVAILGGLLLIVPALATQLVELGRLLPSVAEKVPRFLGDIQGDLNARHVDLEITSLYKSQDLS